MCALHRPRREHGRKMMQVNFRVGEWEKARLDELVKRSGLSQTEYLLASTVYSENVSGLNYEQLQRISDELRAQGVNLNQAMRLANTLHMEGREGKSREAIRDLVEMRKSLERVQNELYVAIRDARPRRFSPEDALELEDFEDHDVEEEW